MLLNLINNLEKIPNILLYIFWTSYELIMNFQNPT